MSWKKKEEKKVLVISDPEAQLEIKKRWDEFNIVKPGQDHVVLHLFWQTVLQHCPEAVGGRARWYVEDHGTHITLTERGEDE